MTNNIVLFHLNQLGFGGTEKAILLLARELKKSNFKPLLFYNDERSGFRYWRLKLTAPKRYLQKYVHAYAREKIFEQEFGPECFFSGTGQEFIALANKIQPALIHFNRGEESDFYTENIAKISTQIPIIETNIFGRAANDKYLRRVSRFLFVSHWLKNKSPWGGDKAFVLYNPIDSPKTPKTLREKLSIPANAKVIGMMGRPDLASDDFVKLAVEPLLDFAHIICLGLKPNFTKLNHPRLHLVAPTADESELSQFYNSLDVFAHRRLDGETFGMIIAEAMMHGKPVVSHLSPVDNAQVEVLGDSHWVTEFQDHLGYKERILSLLNNSALYSKESARVKSRAEELFLPGNICQQLISHYNSIL